MEKPRRESRFVERRPEAVAGAAEVLLDGGGIEAGIDAAEEDVEVQRDDVGKRRIGRGGDLLPGRFQKFSASPPMYLREAPSSANASMR